MRYLVVISETRDVSDEFGEATAHAHRTPGKTVENMANVAYVSITAFHEWH